MLMRPKSLAGTALILLLTMQHSACAQTSPSNGQSNSDQWSLCPFEAMPSMPHYSDNLVHVLADHAFLNPHGTSKLEGHVQLTRGDQTLLSNAVIFNNGTQLAVSDAPLTLESPDLLITGMKGHYDLRDQTGTIHIASYHLYPMHAHGKAMQIIRLGPAQTALSQATYSTCPVGHQAWQLSASEVHLNESKGVGSARNVMIRFKGVPILFTPYLSFPLSNKRKSGLLAPIIGQTTNAGFEYQQPIYWNIAPQADATFSPEIFGRRGFGLGAQLRYLEPHSYSELNTNYLPHDQLFGGSRYFISLRQQTHSLAGLSGNIDYNRVSDPNYFNDLGTTLQNVDTTFLAQSAELGYQNKYWSMSTMAQQYQILDPAQAAASTPYAVLPKITFDARLPTSTNALQVSLQSQWARFIRTDSVIGSRLDLMPMVRLPLTGTSWFFTPTVAYRYTAYRLQDQPTGLPSNPTRSLPLASLDGGLYFERSAGAHTLQTLEPRLFYLYVPYRDQQDLPIFDTTEFPLSFSQLFSDNRFLGADRVSNADQLTAAITTRFIDTDTGSEWMSASLGQIFYFKPQLVTLPDQPVDTARRSDYVSKLNVAIAQHWWAYTGINVNSITHDIDTATINAQYRLSQDKIVEIGYQFYRGQYEQTSLSLAWPLSRHWQLATSWSYSTQQQRLLQAFAGLQYDSCCWAVRMLAQRYLTTINGSYNDGIFFELVLKGLGNLGTPIGTYLKRTIPDYVPPA